MSDKGPSTLALLAMFVSVLACGPKVGTNDTEQPAGETDKSTQTGDEITQICEHNYELLVVRAGAGSPAVHNAFIDSCSTNSAARREALGEAAWTERKRCVLAAEDADALGVCDGRAPKPKPEPVPATGDLDSELVCRHIAKVIESEFQSQGQVLWTGEELEVFVNKCIEDLARERLEDPAEFDRQARCILGTSSIDDFDRCDD